MGLSHVWKPFGVSSLFQAGVYRLRPMSKLDPLLDDFMGPGNPWELPSMTTVSHL